jgi:predicted ATPase
MYVRRVVLRDLKGFRELDFDFSRPEGTYEGWTVITGDNASGKTALLKAIALAIVGPDIARVLQSPIEGWIRKGEEVASAAVEIVPHDKDSFAHGRRAKTFWSELEWSRTGAVTTLAPASVRRRRKKGPIHGPWNETTSGWFAAGYGPFRRLYGASPDAQRLMSGPSRVARFATMFREDATLGECEIWLKDLSYKKLESRVREGTLLDSVVGLLNSEFLRNGLRVERVDSDGLWLKDSAGSVLPLSEMSEGYRAAIAMLIDIVRQLSSVFGADGLVSSSGVIEHRGVVLIDEVDSHLHPEWQRQIGLWLRRHFPGIQFIVTTHSPLICQAADQKGLFHLPAPGSDAHPFQLSDKDYWQVVKSNADVVYLSPAFDLHHTRSPRTVDARRKFAELNAKKAATRLSAAETTELGQLALFVDL